MSPAARTGLPTWLGKDVTLSVREERRMDRPSSCQNCPVVCGKSPEMHIIAVINLLPGT